MQVAHWFEPSMREALRGMRAIAFDLDGTLASSRQPMSRAMAQALSVLSQRMPIAIVTGGRYELVQRQVVQCLTPEARLDAITLMPTSGAQCYHWRDGAWQLMYARVIEPSSRQRIIAVIEHHAHKQGVWFEQVWGQRIEDRGSQITFSAYGQQAPLALKAAWDPTGERKRRLADAVAADLPEFLVRSGGFTSVDVSARGVDKAYAVRQLAQEWGIAASFIAFVGDRFDPLGNDYPTVQAGVIPIVVEQPQETLDFLQYLEQHLQLQQHLEQDLQQHFQEVSSTDEGAPSPTRALA